MAATPMAMPSAESPARSLRVRSPTVESRVRSESGNRLRLRVAVAVTTAPGRRARRTQSAVRGGLSGSSGEGGGGSVPAAGPVSATMRPSRISTLRGMRSAMVVVVGDDHDGRAAPGGAGRSGPGWTVRWPGRGCRSARRPARWRAGRPGLGRWRPVGVGRPRAGWGGRWGRSSRPTRSRASRARWRRCSTGMPA